MEHSLVRPVAPVGQGSRLWRTWSWPGLRLLPRLRSGCSAHRRRPRPSVRTGLPGSWCRQPGPGTDTVGQTVHQAKMSQGLSPSGMFSVAVNKCAGLCRNEKMLVTMLRQKAGVQSCIYNVTATLKKKMLKKRSPEGNTPTCEQQLSLCSKTMGYFFLLPCAFYTLS